MVLWSLFAKQDYHALHHYRFFYPFHLAETKELFKVVVIDGDIDWMITNCPDEKLTTRAVQEANDVRWQIEELHRGLKQLTGTEKCECRKGRSQRNHIACCYHAWISLKVKAKTLGKTLYQTKHGLFSDYLRAELAAARIQTLMPA